MLLHQEKAQNICRIEWELVHTIAAVAVSFRQPTLQKDKSKEILSSSL